MTFKDLFHFLVRDMWPWHMIRGWNSDMHSSIWAMMEAVQSGNPPADTGIHLGQVRVRLGSD